jgi:hypothetical protein
MPARLHPGVYVEEVPSPARSIEGASTSTAIFVGETERGPLGPTKIKSRADFERSFGGYRRHATGNSFQITSLTYAIDAFFQNGGNTAYILRAVEGPPLTTLGTRTKGTVKLVATSPGAWSKQLHAVVCQSTADPLSRFRIAVTYQAPGGERRIVENWDRLTINGTDENYVVDVLKRSLYIRWNPEEDVAAPDQLDIGTASPTETEILTKDAAFNGVGGEEDLFTGSFATVLGHLDEVTDASLLIIPARIYDGDSITLQLANAALSYVNKRPQQDLFAIADMPRVKGMQTPTEATNATIETQYSGLSKNNYGAVYFPWIEISDPIGVGRDPTVYVPPSGYVAGLYARTDARRGVWKAPAGLDATLLGIRTLEYKLLDSHQDELNPLGINALRVQPASGAVVWGSRTLQPGGEWRYIPVRRTAIFLRKSIYNGIQWAVFEPNDENLWASLRLATGAFMDQQFRQGAFAGKTAREAFFVKCDAETTPEADQIAGIVNVWVGFAPLRPAEFVVVKLSQIVNQKA